MNFRKNAIAAALILCAVLPVFGQVTYSTVTATVTDPDGQPLANAPFIWRLVDQFGNPVSSATTPNGQPFNAKPVIGNLNGDGTMSTGLVPNNILSKPSGTQWKLVISPPLPVDQSNILTYQPPWNITYATPITANVDLSSQISALAVNVNYFNVQTGQATVAGWLTGTPDPPTLSCGSMSHAGYFYMSAAGHLFQCNKAVGGVWQWNAAVGTVSMIYPAAGLAASTGSSWRTPAFGDVVALFGGGTCSGFLKSDGTCSIVAGGLTSLNGLTGPALSLTSSDSSVTITPSGTNINLQSVGGGGSGVQYNPSTTQYLFTGDSENVDDGHVKGGSLITVTNVNCNGTVCIFTNTGTNGFSAGDWVFTDLISSPSFFSCSTSISGVCNLFQVLSTGLSTTQFEIAYTASTGTGTGGQVENANYFLPFYTCSLPFFKNHGACAVSIPVGATLTSLNTNFSTAIIPYATGTPTFLIINGGKNDIQSCSSAATIEGLLQSIWAKAHTAGMTVIQGTITPNRWNTSTLGCQTAFQTLQQVNAWMHSQRKTAALASGGQYIDRLVDVQSILNDMNSPFWFQSGPSYGALSDLGIAAQAHLINEGMSTQDDAQRGYPYQLIPAPWGGSLAQTADGYAWSPPFADSTNALEFANMNGGNVLLRLDTTGSGSVAFPYLGTSGCLSLGSGSRISAVTCGATGGPFLPLAGGTLSGPLTLPSSPTLPLQAATKDYSDSNTGSLWQRQGTVIPASSACAYATQESSIIETAGVPTDMWYTCGVGTTYIYHSTSTDGGYTWSAGVNVPALAGWIHTYIFQNGSTYYFYGSNNTSFTRFSSSNKTSWTLDASNIMPVSGTGWESTYRGNIWVSVIGGTWYALVESLGSIANVTWSIGEFSSADGITWTEYGSNPVILAPNGGGCGGPDAYPVSGGYVVWTHCTQINNSIPTDIYQWTATALTGPWTMSQAAPLLRLTYDEGVNTPGGQTADPQLASTPSGTMLYYTATDTQTPTTGDGFHIKLATSPYTIQQLSTATANFVFQPIVATPFQVGAGYPYFGRINFGQPAVNISSDGTNLTYTGGVTTASVHTFNGAINIYNANSGHPYGSLWLGAVNTGFTSSGFGDVYAKAGGGFYIQNGSTTYFQSTVSGTVINAGTNTVYRCTGGTNAGVIAWATAVCTAGGGTATATSLKVD